MLNWFIKWKEYRRQAEFERGFGFVMTQHYLHGLPTNYLWDIGTCNIDHTEFDRGMIAALRLLPDTLDSHY